MNKIAEDFNYAKIDISKDKNNTFIVTINWWDGYLETFKADKIRFGSELLWIRLTTGQDRHIPVKQIRWYSLSEESSIL